MPVAPSSVLPPLIRVLKQKERGRSDSHIDTTTLIELDTESPNCRIFFSTDGDDPDIYRRRRDGQERTFRYRSPFTLKPGYRILKAIAVSRINRCESGVASRTFRVDKALRFSDLEPGETDSEISTFLDTPRTYDLTQSELYDTPREILPDNNRYISQDPRYNGRVTFHDTDVHIDDTSSESALHTDYTSHTVGTESVPEVDSLFDSRRRRDLPAYEDIYVNEDSGSSDELDNYFRTQTQRQQYRDTMSSHHPSIDHRRGRQSPVRLSSHDTRVNEDYAAYHKKYSDLPQLDWATIDVAREQMLDRANHQVNRQAQLEEELERRRRYNEELSLLHRGQPDETLYRSDAHVGRDNRFSADFQRERSRDRSPEHRRSREHSRERRRDRDRSPEHRRSRDFILEDRGSFDHDLQHRTRGHSPQQRRSRERVRSPRRGRSRERASSLDLDRTRPALSHDDTDVDRQRESNQERENMRESQRVNGRQKRKERNIENKSSSAESSTDQAPVDSDPSISDSASSAKNTAAIPAGPAPVPDQQPAPSQDDNKDTSAVSADPPPAATDSVTSTPPASKPGKPRSLKQAKDQANRSQKTKGKAGGTKAGSTSSAMNFTNQSGTQINFWGVSPRTVFGEKVKDVKALEESAKKLGTSSSGAVPLLTGEEQQSSEQVQPQIQELNETAPPGGATITAAVQAEQESIGGFFRKFFKGWGSDDGEKKKGKKDKGKPSTTKDTHLSYDQIHQSCLRDQSLWTDPHFQPSDEILFYNSRPSVWPLEWKRARELCADPKFIAGGADRVDVKQGILGDCWLLASLACLTTNKKLLNKVVPPDQSFDQNYAGVFRFNFWQYGKWEEVCVDDLLPTSNGQLVYMHSGESNEFWSALLEKAYAKLCGSYESLSGGLASESMVDFTGGIVERFDFREELPSNLFQIMLKARQRGSLMSCSIDAAQGQMEAQLDNGLIMGHAYSITDVKKLEYDDGEPVQLLRIRNPWGNECEWNGAWSDKSSEWKDISDQEKADLGLSFDHDGEFWMSFTDFSTHFQRLEICNLTADSLGDDGDDSVTWQTSYIHGGWRKKVNAGGCRNYPKTFWTNPQYHVTLTDVDDDDDEGLGTLIVGLMQKDRRQFKQMGGGNLTAGYEIYQVDKADSGTLPRSFFTMNAPAASSPSYINLREVSGRHKLPVGNYVIIPTTFDPNQEADFLLRIITEKESNIIEANLDTVEVECQPLVCAASGTVQAAEALFKEKAGEDDEIDAQELKEVLDTTFQKDFPFDGFDLNTCRSMVAYQDLDQTGKLGREEFQKLWQDLDVWKEVFRQHDADKSGHFNSYEMREALAAVGFQLSNGTFSAVALRYSDKDGFVQFDDFISCVIKMKTMFEVYKEEKRKGCLQTSLDEFIQMTMYS